MYIPVLLTAGWIATAGFLYAQVSSKEAAISELSSEKDNAIRALKSEQLVSSALNLQLKTVRNELREIQVLKENYAKKSIELEYELKAQDELLLSIETESDEYVAALNEIIVINSEYMKCIKINIKQGTLSEDGSRIYQAGQSTCFENYRIQIAKITSEYKQKG
ncbi:MAG: hypothetical protein AB2794_13250 [Candidatus Thiodiazotropha endolucinida]